ncbi:uncharacterized protein N7515_009813 [Penicillium bovifimosum]|uniref:Uncharacterized protein n=1 Tax=Penicillium bovifimosum TaxID=126998 RepID=A0A9W9KV00_9EURO|nr:uncharacterized protein N7515_009813 [Penicillium bovifimosum]KAJ5120425.1 hypothetical protein N7515_009813 [Penicillium bovifimosum]
MSEEQLNKQVRLHRHLCKTDPAGRPIQPVLGPSTIRLEQSDTHIEQQRPLFTMPEYSSTTTAAELSIYLW